MEKQITIEQIFENLERKAPDILTRQKIHELTGGAISPKTLANKDSEGTGIAPRLLIGGKVVYPKKAAIAWLKQNCQIDKGE